jgi:hypothetical protein
VQRGSFCPCLRRLRGRRCLKRSQEILHHCANWCSRVCQDRHGRGEVANTCIWMQRHVCGCRGMYLDVEACIWMWRHALTHIDTYPCKHRAPTSSRSHRMHANLCICSLAHLGASTARQKTQSARHKAQGKSIEADLPLSRQGRGRGAPQCVR